MLWKTHVTNAEDIEGKKIYQQESSVESLWKERLGWREREVKN